MVRINVFSLRVISNLLIGFSLLIFAVLFAPLFTSYLFPARIDTSGLRNGLHIVIPKIHAQSRVFPNVDPWNEAVYRRVLEQGVAHAKGTAFPGEPGMIFLFAHSSGMPWEILRQNIVFLRLDELQQKDTIYIYNEGKQLRYEVIEKKYVYSTDVSSLLLEKRSLLILQTCWPIGTDWKRLLVYAKPVE